MVRLSVESVEQKTSQAGKPYWRFKASDGKYYSTFKVITAGVYDMDIENGLAKNVKPVNGGSTNQSPKESVVHDKERSFAVSYAKDILCRIAEFNEYALAHVQDIEDVWTRLTAHAMWLLNEDSEKIYALAQVLEDKDKPTGSNQSQVAPQAPQETTDTEPF